MTARQSKRSAEQRIVLAIALLTRTHGCSPTLREIAAECGYATPSVVVHHLRRLRALGLVEWRDGKARTIRLVK